MTDNFIIVLLAVMIFGPSIDVRDKNEKLRFEYQGIIFGVVKYLYWTIMLFKTKKGL